MSSKISGPKSKVEKSFDNYYSLNPRACSETHCLFQPDSGCPVAWSWQFPFLLPSLCSCCLLDAEWRRRVEGETGAEAELHCSQHCLQPWIRQVKAGPGSAGDCSLQMVCIPHCQDSLGEPQEQRRAGFTSQPALCPLCTLKHQPC